MGLPEKFVDAEIALHDAAAARCGLHEFGETSYLIGLRHLLESLDEDLRRGPSEREACYTTIISLLVSRLYAQAGWKRNPDCLTQKLERPVFIVGAPRTGTTALHQMLSAAPCWQGLESWLAKTPMTRPPRETWPAQREYRDAVAALNARLAAQPAFRFTHAIAPDEVDEDILITAQTMIANTFGSIMHVPGYDSWFRAQDARAGYRCLADNLRLIGAKDRGKRWLLKDPSHVLDLEELLEIFPDSVVVHIHRDPLKSQPSLWSLLAINHRPRDGEAMNLQTIARREIDLYSRALTHDIDIARRYPARICEIFEDEMTAKPLEVALRIFDFVGEPITGAAEKAMSTWIGNNPIGKHGVHRYAAENFGVSSGEIAERFSAYRAHYGFGAEPARPRHEFAGATVMRSIDP